MDGVGEWATTTAWIGNMNEIKPLWEINFPHSLGLLYSAFTFYCGFKVNSGEYKLMGLAPYGEPKYANLIKDKLIDIKSDGSFKLSQDYFDYATGLKMTNEKFNSLFGQKPRKVEEKLSQIPSGLTLLDAGAGNGNKEKFCKHLNYISQDVAKYTGIEDKEGLHTGEVDYSKLDIISDIIDIPLEDNSLDVILCVEVIEHVENPLLVFKEFSRLLKKDGKLILTAPFNSLTHYAPYHYSTGFSKYYYEKHLPLYF